MTQLAFLAIKKFSSLSIFLFQRCIKSVIIDTCRELHTFFVSIKLGNVKETKTPQTRINYKRELKTICLNTTTNKLASVEHFL